MDPYTSVSRQLAHKFGTTRLVPSYLAYGNGASVVQGSVVTLDDETSWGCTEIIPGFHSHIAEWGGKMVGKWEATDGTVHGMDKIWDARDAAVFGDFIPVPCFDGRFAGESRITWP